MVKEAIWVWGCLQPAFFLEEGCLGSGRSCQETAKVRWGELSLCGAALSFCVCWDPTTSCYSPAETLYQWGCNVAVYKIGFSHLSPGKTSDSIWFSLTSLSSISPACHRRASSISALLLGPAAWDMRLVPYLELSGGSRFSQVALL